MFAAIDKDQKCERGSEERSGNAVDSGGGI